MECIAPPLNLILCLRQSLDRGESLRSGIQEFIETEADSDFRERVSNWLYKVDCKAKGESVLTNEKSLYRRQVLKIAELGLRGRPIYNQLVDLEKEVTMACEAELDEYLKGLPLKALLPLLFLQFPAFLLLFFGPLIRFLMGEFSL